MTRLISALGALILGASAAARDQETWIGTWETSPAALPATARFGSITLPDPVLATGTVRYRVRLSQGGRRIRLRFSNEFGRSPLGLASVSVGLAADGLDVNPGSLRVVTFAGRQSIAIPTGAPALSDAVDLPVKPLADLVVSVYVSSGMTLYVCATHAGPAQQGLVEGADSTHAERSPAYTCVDTTRSIVSGVDVLADRVRPVVVTLGDSITDGSLLPETGDRGWPGVLSRRLQATGISVVNAGIGGNRLLESQSLYGESALSRLDRDVLTVPGVSHLVVLEGTNDIGMSGPGGVFGDTPIVDLNNVIGAYLQIIARSHERGINVIGATLIPFGGSLYDTPVKENLRTAVNRWIRGSGSFDAIVDFDAVMRDASDGERLNPLYDRGDHLHPSPAGYRRMGEAIDPELFVPMTARCGGHVSITRRGKCLEETEDQRAGDGRNHHRFHGILLRVHRCPIGQRRDAVAQLLGGSGCRVHALIRKRLGTTRRLVNHGTGIVGPLFRIVDAALGAACSLRNRF